MLSVQFNTFVTGQLKREIQFAHRARLIFFTTMEQKLICFSSFTVLNDFSLGKTDHAVLVAKQAVLQNVVRQEQLTSS